MKVGDPTNKVKDANSDKGKATSEKGPSTSGRNGTDIYAHVEPPTYGGPIPSTHLNHVNTNLWRIIEEGFYPHDPSNFTPREAADNQFNENALFILQDAIQPEDIAHLRPFTVAKEAWHHVVSLYKGSTSIQRSNYEVVQDEADEFAMKEDEEPRELFRRVTKLVV